MNIPGILIGLFAISFSCNSFSDDWKVFTFNNEKWGLFDNDSISWQTKNTFRVWAMDIPVNTVKERYQENKNKIDPKLSELASEKYLPPFFKQASPQDQNALWDKYPQTALAITSVEQTTDISSRSHKEFLQIGCISKEARILETVTEEGKIFNFSNAAPTYFQPNDGFGSLAKIICPSN